MGLRINLQWRVLVVITGGMALVLGLSAYLNNLITRSLIEDDRYNTAISQTVAIAERIATQQLSSKPEELQRDIASVADLRPDFKQIDVYHRTPGGGWTLQASTASMAPDAPRLPRLDETSSDNDLREMEHPVPRVVTMEVVRNESRYWIISMASPMTTLHGSATTTATGYVTAMVLKNSRNPLVLSLQWEYNRVLAAVILVCAGLSAFLFSHFFRRPARDIVNAMVAARGGNFAARAAVRRPDELGEIAAGFNALMDDLRARDRERDALLTRISGFNDELRAEVARATSELRSANEALLQSQQRLGRSERLAAMGQVAASLAHEIGTPLNSISGHLQLLARRLPNDADAQRRTGIISQQLDSIVGSVRALLRRTHARRASLRPIDLNTVIGELLRLVGPTLDAHGIRVSTLLDRALPPVLGDPDGLHQVLLNLINNSVDAMPSGGRLSLITRLDPATSTAELVVEDTGTGFAPEIVDHLFDPMWTTKTTGSGFGLAIARDIMSDHGGSIDASSAASGGACFRLHIRLADAESAARASHAG